MSPGDRKATPPLPRGTRPGHLLRAASVTLGSTSRGFVSAEPSPACSPHSKGVWETSLVTLSLRGNGRHEKRSRKGVCHSRYQHSLFSTFYGHLHSLLIYSFLKYINRSPKSLHFYDEPHLFLVILFYNISFSWVPGSII